MLTFAWVKGAVALGAASITACSGVAAVELLEKGKVKVTWTVPFPDADYCVTCLAGSRQQGYNCCFDESNPQTPEACSFQFYDSGGQLQDTGVFHVMAVGGQAGV